MNPVYYVMPPDGQPYTGVPYYIQRSPSQQPHYQGNVLYYSQRRPPPAPHSPFHHNYNNNNMPPGPVPYNPMMHHQVDYPQRPHQFPPHSQEVYRFPPPQGPHMPLNLSAEPYDFSQQSSQPLHQGSSPTPHQDRTLEATIYCPQPGHFIQHPQTYLRRTPTPPPLHEAYGIPLHCVQPVQKVPAQTVLSSARISPPFQVPPRLKALGDVFASMSKTKDSDLHKVESNDTDIASTCRNSPTVDITTYQVESDQKCEDTDKFKSLEEFKDDGKDEKEAAGINDSKTTKKDEENTAASMKNDTAEFYENKSEMDAADDDDCDIEIEEHEFLSSTFECKSYTDSEYESDEEGNELKESDMEVKKLKELDKEKNQLQESNKEVNELQEPDQEENELKQATFDDYMNEERLSDNSELLDDLSMEEFASLIVKQVLSRAVLRVKKESEICDYNQNSIKELSHERVNSDNLENCNIRENDSRSTITDMSQTRTNVQTVTDTQNKENIHVDCNKQTYNVTQIEEHKQRNDTDTQEIKMQNVSIDHSPIVEDNSVETRPRLYSWSYDGNQEKLKYEKYEAKRTHDQKSICDHKPSERSENSLESKTDLQSASDVKKIQIPVNTKKADDFDSFYFRQKASRYGIVITSPTKTTRDKQNPNGNLDKKSPPGNDKLKVRHVLSDDCYPDSVPVDGTSHFRRRFSSISASSDSGSDSSQSDAVDDFKQKASRRGIRIVDPNESWDIANQNDIESELCPVQKSQSNFQSQDHKLVSPSHSLMSALNPEVPEFKLNGNASPKTKGPNPFTKPLNPASKVFQPLTSTSGFNPPVISEVWDDSGFAQSALNRSPDMRIDAPEFIPTRSPPVSGSLSVPGSPPYNKLLNMKQKPVVMHLKSPKPVKTSSSIATQASPTITDSCVGTRRIKTKECAMNTGSCDMRNVCVNTDFGNSSECPSQMISPRKPKMISKSTQSLGIGRRSVGVNVKFKILPKEVEKKEASSQTDSLLEQSTDKGKLLQQIRNLQIELMQCKTREITFKLLQQKEQLAKQCDGLIPLFSNSNELDVLRGLIQNRITAIDKSVVAIQVEAEKTILKIQCGEKVEDLPDLTKHEVPTTCSSTHASPQTYMFPTYSPPNYYNNVLLGLNHFVENQNRNEQAMSNLVALSSTNMSFDPHFLTAVTAYNAQYLTMPNLTSQFSKVPNSVSQDKKDDTYNKTDNHTEKENLHKDPSGLKNVSQNRKKDVTQSKGQNAEKEQTLKDNVTVKSMTYHLPSLSSDVPQSEKESATQKTDKNMEKESVSKGDVSAESVDMYDKKELVDNSTVDVGEAMKPNGVTSTKEGKTTICSSGDDAETVKPDNVYTTACISSKLSSPQKGLHTSPIRLPVLPDSGTSNDLAKPEDIKDILPSKTIEENKEELHNEPSGNETKQTFDVENERSDKNRRDKITNILETYVVNSDSPDITVESKLAIKAAVDAHRSLSMQDQILKKMKAEYFTSEDNICANLAKSPLKEKSAECKAMDSIDSDEEYLEGNDDKCDKTDSDETVACEKDIEHESKPDNSCIDKIDSLSMNNDSIVEPSEVGNGNKVPGISLLKSDDLLGVENENKDGEPNKNDLIAEEPSDKVTKNNECEPKLEMRTQKDVAYIPDDWMDLAEAREISTEPSTDRPDEFWKSGGMNDLEEVEPSDELQHEENYKSENEIQSNVENGQISSADEQKVIQEHKAITNVHKNNEEDDKTDRTKQYEEPAVTTINWIMNSEDTNKVLEQNGDVRTDEFDEVDKVDCHEGKTEIKHEEQIPEIFEDDKNEEVPKIRNENMTGDTGNAVCQNKEIMANTPPDIESASGDLYNNAEAIEISSPDMEGKAASAVDPQEIFMSPPKPTREIHNDIDTNKTLAVAPSTYFTPSIPPPPLPGQMPVVGGFDTGLYQAVLSQLIQAYPHLAANQVLLTNTAMQQTQLLQMYMKDQQAAGVGNMTNFPNMPNMMNIPQNLPQFPNMPPAGCHPPPQNNPSSFPMDITAATMPTITTADQVSSELTSQSASDSFSASLSSIQTVKSSSSVQGVRDSTNKASKRVESEGCKLDNLNLPHKANKSVSSPSRPPGIKTVLIDESEEFVVGDRTKLNSDEVPLFGPINDISKENESSLSKLEEFTLPKSKGDNAFQSRVINNSQMGKQSSLSGLEEFTLPKSKSDDAFHFKSTKNSQMEKQSSLSGLEEFTLPKSKSDNAFQSRATNNSQVEKQSSLSGLEEFSLPKSKKIHKLIDESAEKLIMGIEKSENFSINSGISNMNKNNEVQDTFKKPFGRVSQGSSKVSSNSALDDFGGFTNKSQQQKMKASSHDPRKENTSNSSFPFTNKVVNETKPDINKKPNPWKLDTNKVYKVVKQPAEQVVRSRNSSGGSSSRSTPTPPSSAEMDGSFSFKGSSQKSMSQNSQQSHGDMSKLHNLPPRLQKKYQNTKNEMYIPPNKRSAMTVFNDSNQDFLKKSEDWDAEADEYPTTFSLKTGSVSKLTMKRKLDTLPSGIQSNLGNKEDNSGDNNLQKTSQTSTVDNAGLCDIPAPKMTKIETSEKPNEEVEEEWCEVTTKRKRHKSKEQPVKKVSQPTKPPSSSSSNKQQKMSNFEKLIDRLLLEFPGSNRQSIIDAVTKIRTQRGSLSGLSMENIIEKAHLFIQTKTKKHIPGLPAPAPAMNSKPSQAPSMNVKQSQPDMFLPQFISKTFNTQQPAKKNVLQLPPYIPSLTSKAGFDDEEEICVICHDDLYMMETKKLDCNHMFHFKCISQWVERERTCPTCRQHALFPEDFPRLGK